MDNILSHFGLVKKAGRIAIGEEPVGAACRARDSVLVVLASDIAENSARRAQYFAEISQCPCLPLPFDKAALGGALGRSSCAMAAITDIGFAAALLKKLAAIDPEAYAAPHALLEEKAGKALQRQKEKRAHEKKLQRAKKKPWAQGKT